jgi:hydrogenase maturation protease
VVGCTPADLEEGMGLSAPVAAAVPLAADTVRSLLVERVFANQSDPSKQGG